MRLSTLKQTAPIVYSICRGFAVVNISLGLGFIFLYKPNAASIVVANILTYQEWGIAFLITGLLTAWGLYFDDWDLTRKTQLAGITIKTIWEIALIIRSITAPTTFLIAAVWLFLAYIQSVVYIHFPHKPTDQEIK